MLQENEIQAYMHEILVELGRTGKKEVNEGDNNLEKIPIISIKYSHYKSGIQEGVKRTRGMHFGESFCKEVTFVFE
jgi:hypothetical protein